MQQNLLDKYIDEDVSFAIFKYPDSEHYTLIVGEEKILGHSYQYLDNISGFVFSPFDLDKHPIVSIIPHSVITEKLKKTKNTQAKSEENQHTLVQDQSAYAKVFDVFYQSILSEEFSKLVLSRTATYNTKKENLASELFQSATNISGAFVYLCHTPTLGTWLGATPELLLQGKENTWQTVALAGTRHKDTLTDWDDKNIKEQLYVTDYICQVLEQMNCRISLQNIETIQASGVEHLKTKISFSNESDSPLVMSELIESLHPTPAICGLPKKEAFNFIKDNEGYDRSYYSGLVGWINPSEEIRLYVNLRCLKMNNSRSFQLFAGGGLVKSSNKEQEWSETKAKMQTLLSLLK